MVNCGYIGSQCLRLGSLASLTRGHQQKGFNGIIDLHLNIPLCPMIIFASLAFTGLGFSWSLAGCRRSKFDSASSPASYLRAGFTVASGLNLSTDLSAFMWTPAVLERPTLGGFV